MAWWTQGKVHPKVKSKFIVNFGTFFLPNIKSISKPSVEFTTKEYRLINHTFNYPGTAKWSPVEIKFVCMNPQDIGRGMGDETKPQTGTGLDTSDLLWTMIRNSGYYYPTSAEHRISRRPIDGGVPTEEMSFDTTSITTPEKASTVANAFGEGLWHMADYTPGGSPTNKTQRIVIQQIGTNTTQRLQGVEGTEQSATTTRSRERGKTTTYVVEQWDLINPIIKSVNFGDLAYDSDELVEYSMTIAYDYAIFKSHGEYSDEKPDPPLINKEFMTYS